jgi:hypothetical protein
MERADLGTAWQALPEQRREALLTRDRVGLIRWMKRWLQARKPEMNDRAATEMFGT